jgi:hypothetical protein
MLDVVMEASAQSSPSTPHHGKSLGAELQKVVDEAFAFMKSEFAESGGVQQAVEDVALAHGPIREKIIASARKHIHTEDVESRSIFRRAVFWHWANLEYGCSADLGQVCPAAHALHPYGCHSQVLNMFPSFLQDVLYRFVEALSSCSGWIVARRPLLPHLHDRHQFVT